MANPFVTFTHRTASTTAVSTATGTITFDYYNGAIYVGTGTHYETYGRPTIQQNYSSLGGLTLHTDSSSFNYQRFPCATASYDGVMSSEDKAILDTIDESYGGTASARNTNYPVSNLTATVTRSTSTATLTLTLEKANGAYVTGTPWKTASIMIPAASVSSAGLLTSTLCNKLTNLAVKATKQTITKSAHFTAGTTNAPVMLLHVSCGGTYAAGTSVVLLKNGASSASSCPMTGSATRLRTSDGSFKLVVPLVTFNSSSSVSISWVNDSGTQELYSGYTTNAYMLSATI